jgi:hypothetical protein
LEGVTNAVNSGRMAAALMAVPLGEWQASMINKGIQRISLGAESAKPKVAKFMAAFLPHVEAGAAIVRAMPKGGVENGVARAAAMIRHNATFKNQR